MFKSFRETVCLLSRVSHLRSFTRLIRKGTLDDNSPLSHKHSHTVKKLNKKQGKLRELDAFGITIVLPNRYIPITEIILNRMNQIY